MIWSIWYIDDCDFDKSISHLFSNVSSVTTLIVKELLYINSIFLPLQYFKKCHVRWLICAAKKINLVPKNLNFALKNFDLVLKKINLLNILNLVPGHGTIDTYCGSYVPPKNFNLMSKNLVPKILLSAQKFQFSAKKLNLVPKNFNSVPKKFNLVPKSFKFSAAEINSAEKIKNSVEKKFKNHACHVCSYRKRRHVVMRIAAILKTICTVLSI